MFHVHSQGQIFLHGYTQVEGHRQSLLGMYELMIDQCPECSYGPAVLSLSVAERRHTTDRHPWKHGIAFPPGVPLLESRRAVPPDTLVNKAYNGGPELIEGLSA